VALRHILFRCPSCGHDPLTGEGDRAYCSSCQREFVRRKAGGTIEVLLAGQSHKAPIGDLTRQIEDLGGALPAALGPDGTILYEARVLAQEADVESPVRFRGQVLGFFEQLGEGESGRLVLDEEAMRFFPDSDPAAPKSWLLLGIRAVQSASSSIQISPSEGGVVLFRFEVDSPLRWESLLKSAMQRAYDRAGRGTIHEFQPRIVSG